ncbi:MAG TPA: hypothetical protein VMA34_03150 [Terracidiphilus sp.]|nr:hypothetical protein [Terracidiphilus sp.]
MRERLLEVLLIVTVCAAEIPFAGAQSVAGTPVPQPTVSAAEVVVLPAGTAVPLTLVTPIKSKSTKPGDTVHAQVAFPVTSGGQVAIPAGAYVEGVISKLAARTPQAGQPDVQIHFTRLFFSNGYSVPLDAENTQAKAAPPDIATPRSERTAVNAAPPADPAQDSFGFTGQQSQLPPLQQPGPSPAVVGGAVAGGFVAFLVATLAWAHHRRSSIDYVLFDAGWQFQMVLASPLTLNLAEINTAAASPAVK